MKLKSILASLRASAAQLTQRGRSASSRSAWNSRTPLLPKFDGTVGSLIDCYFTDPASPYTKRTIEFATRQNYKSQCKHLRADLGHRYIKDISGRDLQDWADIRINKGQIPMAHSLVSMFSTLLNFGGSLLDSEACRRLSAIRSKMRFPMAKARTERITAEQAMAIIRYAVKHKRFSIAFAQAGAFEAIQRQKDMIGAWIPEDEKEASKLIVNGQKWVRGWLWDELDDELIIHHMTSKKKKMVHVSLRDAPMVMDMLRILAGVGPDVEITRDMLPAEGPIVVNEDTGLPYQSYDFRRIWRSIANEVGVPKNVKQMDSRAGGISEAIDAGVDPDFVRQAAAHTQFSTTARYIRNQQNASTKTLRGRALHREAQFSLAPIIPTQRAPSKARRRANPTPRQVKQVTKPATAKNAKVG